MKKILVLILIYSMKIQASEQGCTIPFFNQGKSSCKSTKKNSQIITIEPIVINKAPKKKSIDTKKVEKELHNILSEVKKYKNKTEEQKKQLLEELTDIRKEFYQYKLEKSKELKQLKTQLDYNNKKLVKVQKEVKKITKKVKKKKKKHFVKKIKRVEKITKEEQPIIVENTIETVTTPKEVHKVIHKMEPLPIPIYDTPWIEITVEDNINIYELALRYYGDKEEYQKIYTANQKIIGDDFKIYNGMNLRIPMTTDFEEQGILINQ